MKSDKSRKRFVFLCVAPATILFFIFMILPTLNVFRMSLYERGAYSPNETFVGLRNFQHLLKDTQFIRSMQNMILLVVVVTIITFAFALVFAAILTREKIKGQNFFRIIFYIPNILSVVVISGIFSAIYKPENGMLNSIIGLFRDMTDPILWKGEKLVIPSIIIAMVWQAVGYYGDVYGFHVLGACQLVRERQSGRSGPSDPVLPDHDSAGLDEHPYHPDLLYHFHHQYGVPVRQGDDQRRAERCLGCGPELYVQPERCRSVRLQHGNRCGYLPVLVRFVCLCQSCHQP